MPIGLGILAIADLHVELALLLDHFTWVSLAYIPGSHPLAVVVLCLLPSLWHRYR